MTVSIKQPLELIKTKTSYIYVLLKKLALQFGDLTFNY